jgi:hypothetical protein
VKKIAGIFLAIVVVCSGLVTLMIHSCEKAEEASKERYRQECKKQFEDQIAEIKAGKSNTIHFYCSNGTDLLLRQAANVPEIQNIVLQLTDVTDDGMNFISMMPNLKKLVVYGGAGVDDHGFTYIKNIKSLKTLSLINTKITDQSLPSLKDLPSLHELIVFHERWRGQTFTDAGLIHLKKLTNLKKLNLSGGWASEKAVEELRQALPQCNITTTEDYDLSF